MVSEKGIRKAFESVRKDIAEIKGKLQELTEMQEQLTEKQEQFEVSLQSIPTAKTAVQETNLIQIRETPKKPIKKKLSKKYKQELN